MVVCYKCRVRMKVVRIGLPCQEVNEEGMHYRFLNGDVLACPECKCKVVTGFGTPCYDKEYNTEPEFRFT